MPIGPYPGHFDTPPDYPPLALAQQDYLDVDSSQPPGEYPAVSGASMHIAFKQREAIRLAACGIPYLEISRRIYWSMAAVHEFLTSRIAQAQIRALSEKRDITAADIACTIQELAPGAMAYLEKVLYSESEDPKLRTKVAHDLLDRAGHAPVKRTISLDVPLAGSVLEDIKRHARKAGILAAEPVTTEAEPTGERSELALDTSATTTPAGEQSEQAV